MRTGLLLAAFGLASTISFLAYQARLLSLSGALAAALLGTAVFGLGGWQWAVVLLAFFSSSSLLSKAFKARKQASNQEYAKADRRDASQVAANGGLAAVFIGLRLAFGDLDWIWIGFAAALAAANADTWATELGALSWTKPRLITHLWREVEPGTSGAISVTGTLAAMAGAVTIAAVASLVTPGSPCVRLVSISIGGFAGALVDSVLGATAQAIYFCSKDNRQTEKHPYHTCGSPTVLIRGWAWLNNDWVNVICTAAGALVGSALGVLLSAT